MIKSLKQYMIKYEVLIYYRPTTCIKWGYSHGTHAMVTLNLKFHVYIPRYQEPYIIAINLKNIISTNLITNVFVLW